MFYYEDKKYTRSAKIDNYVDEHGDYTQWCQYCVYFGDKPKYPYWLCVKHYPEISIVSYCGHCDKFSDTEKINLLKRCLLKLENFRFKNITR